VGNRIAHSRVQGAWDYDANNRLVQRGIGLNATFYQYDEAGNLTQKSEPGKVTRYAYDTQNRLIEVRDGGDNLIARYGYDPLDRRIWKETYSSGEGRRTYYLYADEGLIAEAVQAITLNADGSVVAATTPQITTQYGPRPDADFTTGILFVKTKDSNGQDRFAYFHHDHLDTPIQATDKNGNLVWAANYNIFGQATITTPAATADSPTITSHLRLPGQIEDPETGLHYNFRRYYDPATGRYITQDPIGLAGGLNQYAYVDADPNNLYDPTGEIAPAIILIGTAARAYGACLARCTAQEVVLDALSGACVDVGNSAKNCALSCLNPLNWGGKASPKSLKLKRGPKTDPNAPHNKRIREIADKIENDGGNILAGGGRLKEQKIYTPGGYKDSRRPDILYRGSDGAVKGVNVGRTKADGSPVPREVKALDDLNNNGNLSTKF